MIHELETLASCELSGLVAARSVLVVYRVSYCRPPHMLRADLLSNNSSYLSQLMSAAQCVCRITNTRTGCACTSAHFLRPWDKMERSVFSFTVLLCCGKLK